MTITPHENLVIRSMNTDRATLEVARTFRAARVRWLLLKGRSITLDLYPDLASRPYVDADVLVEPAGMSRAEELLEGLGYRPTPYSTRQEFEHDSPWRREDGSAIDLHRGFTHIPAAASATWEALSRDTRQIQVAGEMIDIPGKAAAALLIALHALHDAPRKGKSLVDLERASEKLSFDLWQGALSLACELGAEQNLNVALGLTPQSKAVADGLGLPRLSRWETSLRKGERAAMAALVDSIFRERGIKGMASHLLLDLTRGRPEHNLHRTQSDGRNETTAAWQLRRIGRGIKKLPLALAAWMVQRKDFR
jgi:hypothetical protein